MFHHIPRTGGATLSDAFRKVYGVENVSDTSGPTEAASGGDPQVLITDWSYGLYHPSDRIHITILRNPIERLVSWLRFHRQGLLGEHRAREEAFTHPGNEYLQRDDGVVGTQVRDRFVRQLGGDWRNDLIPIETAYDVALGRLDRMFWVGHTETLDDDMGVLFDMLYMPNPHISPRNQAQGPALDLDVGVLEELTRWDRKLIDEGGLR